MGKLVRIGAAIVALGLFAAVVRLGMLSGEDSRFVVWFGLASALAAPAGFLLLGYAISSPDTGLIQRLAKVPEIATLMAEAKTQEDKVRVLEREQARLEQIVRLESRRQATCDRIDSLERDAARILQELDNLDCELGTLDENIGDSIVSQEIGRLRERVGAKTQDHILLPIGSRTYRVDTDVVKALPFGAGIFALAYIRLLARVLARSPRSRE